MGILEGIIGLLSSNAIGSVVGWVGGWLNKKEDRNLQVLLLEDKQKDRQFELDKRRIDIEVMEKELAGKEKVAVIQKEGEETKAALSALSESYKHDASLKGSPKIESFRASIRPIITIWAAFVGTIQAAAVIGIAFFLYKVSFSPDQMFELVKYTILWVFFQAGLCIGWWFANRPSTPPAQPKL